MFAFRFRSVLLRSFPALARSLSGALRRICLLVAAPVAVLDAASPNDLGLAFGHGVFVGAGNGGLYSSTDGFTWTQRLPSPVPGSESTIAALKYLNGRFVAVGTRGLICTSVDGIVWTRQTAPVGAFGPNAGPAAGRPYALWDVAYGNGLYVAAGQLEFLTSPDGVTWTRRTSPAIVSDMVHLHFGGGKFVASSLAGRVTVSADGINWRTVYLSETIDFFKLADGAGGWVALTFGGQLWTSTDAETWVRSQKTLPAISPGSASFFANVVFAGTRYYLLGTRGLLASINGTDYSVVSSSAIDQQFTTLAAGGGVFVAGGYKGNVFSPNPEPYLNSADGLAWSTTPFPVLTILAPPRSQLVDAGSTAVFSTVASLPDVTPRAPKPPSSAPPSGWTSPPPRRRQSPISGARMPSTFPAPPPRPIRLPPPSRPTRATTLSRSPPVASPS
ncbi:MAG: hypothetical protein NTV51_20130 [Verrucomicrobia bacterium]|nr:hypothetical protein [Verrucomicrobiota bacterium]